MREPTRNNMEAFLVKNIAQTLEKDGYTSDEVDRGVNESLRCFRESATFGRGGAVPCLLSESAGYPHAFQAEGQETRSQA